MFYWSVCAPSESRGRTGERFCFGGLELNFSIPCSNVDILHSTKSLCLQLFKEKILKEIIDQGMKDFIRV